MATIRYYVAERDYRCGSPKSANRPVEGFNATIAHAIEDDCTFRLVCNLEDNQFYLVHGKLRKADRELMKFNFRTLPSGTPYSSVRRQVTESIRAYNKENHICKSTVIKEYGKKGLLSVAFSRAVDNPYYRCASDMELYNREVVEYQLRKQGHNIPA